MRLMITGAAGMLGQDLSAAARAAGFDVIAKQRAELDICDAAAVATAVHDARPEVIVNCAAYTNVDGAESERELAFAVNGEGAGNVARAANDGGAWTIHVSTDYVFDGSKQEPYLESDPTAPLAAYGASKLEGERAVAASAPDRHTIVRSSWLFGAGGPCFPATIIRLANERDELTVVDDQVGCPTFTGHLARALADLAADPIPGLLHVAADDFCSWFRFAQEIVHAAGLVCDIRPGKTAAMNRPAARPAYSVIRSERGAPSLPDWRQGLAGYMAAAVLSR
jgi:dTDP-4-dehydrorhamnose reductase